MNRRNFFSRLSAAIVGCYLGVGVKLPKLEEADDFLLMHNYESRLMTYYPTFQDFLIEHLKNVEADYVADNPWVKLLEKCKWKPNGGNVKRKIMT